MCSEGYYGAKTGEGHFDRTCQICPELKPISEEGITDIDYC